MLTDLLNTLRITQIPNPNRTIFRTRYPVNPIPSYQNWIDWISMSLIFIANVSPDNADALLLVDIPHAHGLVHRARQDLRVGRSEGDCSDVVSVALQSADALPVAQGPDFDGAVRGTRDDELPAGGDGQWAYFVAVAFEESERPATRQFEHLESVRPEFGDKARSAQDQKVTEWRHAYCADYFNFDIELTYFFKWMV